MGSGFRVDNNRSDISGPISQVFITQWGLMRPAALLHLFHHPFLDFGGKVGGIKLGDDGVDAFDQFPRGSIFDVLNYGD